MSDTFEVFDDEYERRRAEKSHLGDTPLQMVIEFAKAMNQPLDRDWVSGTDLDQLRIGLISEEYSEVMGATDAANLLKELADLAYVTYGKAATFGWDLDEAIRRIHTSNMSKLGADGAPIYRKDGKVLKGPNYKEPNLTDLI